MIVELHAIKRRRPRRAVIIHRVIVLHEDVGCSFDGMTIWEEGMVFEANHFITMLWPRGPEAWENITCRICNREFLWDKELNEKCPQCPHCANEFFEL